MATWVLSGQLTNGGSLALNASDNIWLNGTTFANAVIVGSYQDSTHISDVNNIQRDLTASVHNTKFLTTSTTSVDGGSSVALSTVTSGTAPLHFNFTNASPVATSAATFYAYDGVTDANAFPAITFQAAEVGNSTWTAANGSGSALTLQNQGSATSHDFFICISASPTATGAKAGSLKLTLTFA